MKSLIRHTALPFLVMLSVAHVHPVPAQSSTAGPEDAAILFDNGQYQEALGIWYGLVEDGYTGSAVYYNIGLAESRNGNTVAAILAYEKALRFSPGNDKIHQALASERKKIENSIIPVPSFFLARWYKGFLALLRPGGWTWLGLLLAGLVTVQFLLQFRNKPDFRITANLHATLAFACVLCFVAGGLRYRQIYASGEAITGTISEVHQSADAGSPVTRILHPGEKVVVLDAIGEWQRVSMLNLDEGWIRKDGLIPIRP